MNTYGVSSEVLVACLGFRQELANYFLSGDPRSYEEDFLKKVGHIYNAFGCSASDVSFNDLVVHIDDNVFHDRVECEYLFPVFDELQYGKWRVNLKRVLTTMEPIWKVVRSSKDLVLLLKHRKENPVFDDVLFSLIMSGAWNFGDYLKTCGDLSIIRNRFYKWNGRTSDPDKRLGGYDCIPYMVNEEYLGIDSIDTLIWKSFVGCICAESTSDEILKYDNCFNDVWNLMKKESKSISTEGLLKYIDEGPGWRINYTRRFSFRARCDLLAVSYRVRSSEFRRLLQSLSLTDVVRHKYGIRPTDRYDEGLIDPGMVIRLSRFRIADGGLLRSMKVSEKRNGVETKITVK